jgi:sugar phosphate isomerase/epimerase
MTYNRRRFLGAMPAALAATRVLKADPMGMPIGCQTWPVRAALAKDFEGTLRELAGIGFKTIEMCSPHSYADFRPLASLSAAQIRNTIETAGLRCESCHYGFRELKENLDERMAFAKELGLKQMVLASFGLPAKATLADWKQSAVELNRVGERTQKAGIQLGFHNHNGEFQELEGVLIYDELMRQFDAKLVKMQFQVAVISLGFEATTYLKKYPGRFLSMHLADYSTADKTAVAVGSGVVDWKKLFAAAKAAGVQNYFVEMELREMKLSYEYLHKHVS